MQQQGPCRGRIVHSCRSVVSVGFSPNQKLAAFPSCSCFSVPEQHVASSAGGKGLGCCVSAKGYYRALCGSAPVSEQWRGRAEVWQFLVQASGKLLSSSGFSGNIVSARLEWSETQDKCISWSNHTREKKKKTGHCHLDTNSKTEGHQICWDGDGKENSLCKKLGILSVDFYPSKALILHELVLKTIKGHINK